MLIHKNRLQTLLNYFSNDLQMHSINHNRIDMICCKLRASRIFLTLSATMFRVILYKYHKPGVDSLMGHLIYLLMIVMAFL